MHPFHFSDLRVSGVYLLNIKNLMIYYIGGWKSFRFEKSEQQINESTVGQNSNNSNRKKGPNTEQDSIKHF
jgi:hypothetical protein